MSELERRKLLQVLCLSSLALTLDHRVVLADSGSGSGGEGGESGGGGEGGDDGGGESGGGDDGGESGGGESGNSGSGSGNSGSGSGNSGSGSSNSGSGSSNSGSGSSNSGSGSGNSGSGSSNSGSSSRGSSRGRNRGARTGERIRDRGNGAEAQRAIRAGKAKPLPEILSAVRERYKGRIIGVEFGQRSGMLVYRVKLVGVSGRVVEVNVNARSKRIMSVRNY